MAQQGNRVDPIMDMVEQQYPQLKDSEFWNQQRGKTGEQVVTYTNNLIKNTGLLNGSMKG
jgi:hypothetical protein